MASQSPAARVYLLLYNSINALLWLRILITVLRTYSQNLDVISLPALYTVLEPQVRWTQTLAVAEILHAAIGALKIQSLIETGRSLTSEIHA